MRPLAYFFSFFCVLCLLIPPASANEAMLSALQESVSTLQKNMLSLESTVQSQSRIIQEQAVRIQTLEGGLPAGTLPAPGATSGAVPAGAPAMRGLSQGFNPDIGVSGTVQAKMTEDSTDGEGNDAIALKELEVSFAQVVDPYSRLDAIITFNDNLEEQNVDIEEAYYTHWGLPLGFRGQIGKFRAKIGKQNLQHLHQLATTEYAMVIRDFFGDEGLASSGARLVHDIPNPWDVPLEITGEILRGNNGNSFSGISRRPIFNVHAKSFFEMGENADLELGGTTLFGDENASVTELDGDGNEITVIRERGNDHYGVKVYGADATMNFYLPEGKVVKLQNELYFQRRSSTTRHSNRDPWGFYTLLDYRFTKRFSTGIRFDYVEPLDVADSHHASTAVSPYLTFWQSEFADFRLQYTHTDPANADAPSDNTVVLAANFLIGAHQHPVA